MHTSAGGFSALRLKITCCLRISNTNIISDISKYVKLYFFEIVKNNFSLFYFQSCPPPVWSGSVGFSPGFSGVDGLSPGFSSPESGFESLSPVSGLVGVEGFESSEEEEPVEEEPDEVLSVEVVVLPEEEPEVSVDAVPEG